MQEKRGEKNGIRFRSHNHGESGFVHHHRPPGVLGLPEEKELYNALYRYCIWVLWNIPSGNASGPEGSSRGNLDSC